MVTLVNPVWAGKIDLVYHPDFMQSASLYAISKRCSCFWRPAQCWFALSWLQSHKLPRILPHGRNGWKVKPWLSFLTLMTESLTARSEGYIKWVDLLGSWGREGPWGKVQECSEEQRSCRKLFSLCSSGQQEPRGSCIYNTTFVAFNICLFFFFYHFWKAISKGRISFALNF